MKYILVILSVFLFVSCGNKEPKFIPKTDTVFVLYRTQEGINYQKGVYTTEKARVFDDSVSLVARAGIDTAWTIQMPNRKDTMKDAKGKPLYDSVVHSYKFNSQWYKLSPLENKTVRIQIVTI